MTLQSVLNSPPATPPSPKHHDEPSTTQASSPPPSHPSLLTISPSGFHFRAPPPPHLLTPFLTPDTSLFQTIHMGAAEIDPSLWTLTLSGLVSRPLTLTLPSLLSLPQTTLTSFHECWGSPLVAPTNFVRRIGNVRWTGVRLSVLLEMAGVRAGARYVWADGMEGGEFGGIRAERYRKDVTIGKAWGDEVLVAWGMNGEGLGKLRGGPVRLVVPGWYGTNSVKWLGGLRVEAERAEGPFTTRFYNERLADGGSRPVWGVEVSSVIVAPGPGEVLDGGEVEVWGWAWSEEGVKGVEVGVDGVEEWVRAEVVERREFEWQRFSVRVELEPGTRSLVARATSRNGETQPLAGRRNHVHTVQVEVR